MVGIDEIVVIVGYVGWIGDDDLGMVVSYFYVFV